MPICLTFDFLISLLNIWKDFEVLSRFMQKWIQPHARSDHNLHRILSSYWLAHFYLMKITAKVLLYFGLDCGMLEFSRAVIQRSIDVSPAFLGTCKPWYKQAGGWIHFCMKRLRTLNYYQKFKIKNKKSKTYSGWCSFQGLSNGTTLMQIQSGRTVPLILQFL